MRLDFVPIWLSKITITKKMEQETPDLADKLLSYQLQAKDILAAAFLPKKETAPLTLQKQVQVIAQGTSELYERVGAAEERITVLEDTMTIDYGQQRVLGEAVNKTVITVLGGQDAPAYKDIGRRVFAECNHDLKAYFKVNARANVPKKRFDEAVEYARKWKPCTNTAMMIAGCNAQQSLDLEGGGFCMNALDKVSVDLSVLADRERYGMRGGMESSLREAAREIDSAADALRTAADGVIVSAQNIINIVTVALALSDSEQNREANRKVTEQMEQLREWVRVIREGGAVQ